MEQWAAIHRRVLVEGVSKRQILRETGMHWTTLEKILTLSRPPGYRLKQLRQRPKLGTSSYHEEGLKLIELAQVAHDKYLAANPVKQAKILKTVVSNLVFDGATITPIYRKPFDVLAERPSSENWLP